MLSIWRGGKDARGCSHFLFPKDTVVFLFFVFLILWKMLIGT